MEEDDTEKLAARREANRVHALKSRQRSKALLQELQRTVTQLSGEKSELERENAVLRAQIDVLQQQNIALTQSQRMLLMRAGHLGPGAGMNAFAPGLFGLSQAASMPAPGPGSANANTQAPGGSENQGSHGGNLDQAAVAAAAAAMIQGQAAAAAAAYNPQFQQFMGGFQGMGQTTEAPTSAAPAPVAVQTPAAPAPPAPTTQVNTTAPSGISHPLQTPDGPPQTGLMHSENAPAAAATTGDGQGQLV